MEHFSFVNGATNSINCCRCRETNNILPSSILLHFKSKSHQGRYTDYCNKLNITPVTYDEFKEEYKLFKKTQKFPRLTLPPKPNVKSNEEIQKEYLEWINMREH